MTAFDESPEPYLFDQPPADVYELTWLSGHMEKIVATEFSFFNERITFLADKGDGRPRLVLSTREDALHTVRNVTEDESLPLGGGEPA